MYVKKYILNIYMNSNKKNSNNFLLGVSSNKNNSFEKINNETMNNSSMNIRINNGMINNQITNNQMKNNTKTYSNNIMKNISKAKTPLNTKKIIFGIIDKLEDDIIKINNKINALNKEKVELKDLSNKEIKTLKEVIMKLYTVLSYNVLMSSTNLSKNDRIKLLNKLKNTIKENESFMEITNKIVRNNKSFNNISLINESHNNYDKSTSTQERSICNSNPVYWKNVF